MSISNSLKSAVVLSVLLLTACSTATTEQTSVPSEPIVTVHSSVGVTADTSTPEPIVTVEGSAGITGQ